MIEKNLTPIIEESFLQFAGAVLQSRALVDVRDCLKPSARQIFYCMETDGFVHSKPFQKTLKSIGSCFRLYLHGDSSAEGVIMRAGQPFAMRYPLVDVEGSYGTLISSGSWAAPRYTGARLSKLAEYLFADIKKDVIHDWRDNYDNTEQYPSVLSSKGFYNLVNGSFGLGVGASASIPQFNIRELNNALIYLIDHPDCDFEDIYVAPDFATGATIINGNEIKESLKNGNGAACKIRSTVEWDANERCFVVTEIPFMVYTETICKELEEIVNSEDNPGIERFNDLTGKTPLIKIYLEKKATPDKILNYLYKNTSLQSYFGINLTMLDQGRYPKLFTWKETLQAHIDHERVVYRRGFEFDLKKIDERIHIINGILTCLASIDEVVKVIKSSESTAAASLSLQKNFLLDESQAKAVLDMKLSRLAHLETQKLENEKASLQTESTRIHTLLENDELFKNELKNGWRDVANKFGDERRTKILQLSSTNDEPIEQKRLSASLTNKGAIFITETSTLYSQRRNSTGAKFKLEKGEYITDNLIGENIDDILFFTSSGNYYHAQLNDFAIGEKQYLINMLPIPENETIVAAAVLSKDNPKPYILFITKNGIVKKSEISEYNLKRKTGAAAIKLDAGDEIVSILFTNNEKIGMLTELGNFLMIDTSDIRPIGRIARGIIGMKLNEDDHVITARIVPDNTSTIISITGNGLIKQTPFNEFGIQSKNTKGTRIQKLQDLDWMADFIATNDTEILITSSSSCLKIKTTDIPLLSKSAQGVKSIKMSAKDNIIKISKL